MRKRSILLLVGALAIVASARRRAGRNGEARAGERRDTGPHPRPGATKPAEQLGEQRPLCDRARSQQHLVRRPDQERQGESCPAALHEQAQGSEVEPATVRFQYKPSAVWSDGKPVTCADLRATWRVWVNPQYDVDDRTGWEDIKSMSCKGKVGTVVFKKAYADYEALLSTGPYAAHTIAGKNMNQEHLNSVPISNGPWRFQSWQKGVQLTVVKNPTLQRRAEDEARPRRLAIHPRHERPVPGA